MQLAPYNLDYYISTKQSNDKLKALVQPSYLDYMNTHVQLKFSSHQVGAGEEQAAACVIKSAKGGITLAPVIRSCK